MKEALGLAVDIVKRGGNPEVIRDIRMRPTRFGNVFFSDSGEVYHETKLLDSCDSSIVYNKMTGCTTESQLAFLLQRMDSVFACKSFNDVLGGVLALIRMWFKECQIAFHENEHTNTSFLPNQDHYFTYTDANDLRIGSPLAFLLSRMKRRHVIQLGCGAIDLSDNGAFRVFTITDKGIIADNFNNEDIQGLVVARDKKMAAYAWQLHVDGDEIALKDVVVLSDAALEEWKKFAINKVNNSYVYVIPSDSQEGVSLEPEECCYSILTVKQKLSYLDIQVLTTLVSRVFVRLHNIVYRRRIDEASVMSAIGSIMSRNGSHNIGSHVLAALSHNVGTMPDDRVLYQYIQQRMDYMASATTDFQDWSVPTSFVGELMKHFYSQYHLLEHIAGSEGLHAYRYQGKPISLVDGKGLDTHCIKVNVRRIEKKYTNNKIKTFISADAPMEFTSSYVNGSISFDLAKTRQVARLMAYLKYLKPKYAEAIETLTSAKARLDDVTQVKIGLLSRYTIITGPGGTGKSMLLKHLLLEASQKGDSCGFIPIFTSLKEFNADYSCLEDCIYGENVSLLAISPDKFKTDLKKGGFLLLLDGLDEVSYQNMVVFDRLLEKFITENPNNQIVMSSRPYTDFVSYKRFTVLKMLPLRKEQSVELIEKIPYNVGHPEIKREFISRIQNSQFDKHKDFISNPLLLTIMFMTFEQYGRIADRIHVFYNDAYQTMYWKHDRGNNHNLERKFKTGYDCDTFAEYLSEFCARSYFEDKFIFSWDEIDRLYQSLSLNKNAKEKHSTRDFVDDLADNLCLVYRTNDGYDFYHRSFQEYFCALYFSNDKTDAQLSSFANLYSDIRSKKKGDQTFAMLYDMIPGRIEASILLSFLKNLLGSGDVTDY